jgi:uncharacterized protein (TIGR02147 family)
MVRDDQMNSKKRPSIFQYSDYRAFLRDHFAFMKATNASYSFRTFSRLAGFSSPNFLQLVYDGKRNLSNESVERVASAFRLTKSETSFLNSLVRFNQADTNEEKNEQFERMLQHRQYRKIRMIVPDQFEYYSKPYHIALRELVDTADFREDPEWISERLRHQVSEKEIREGIELLLKLGFLKRVNGKLALSESSMSTSPEVSSLAVMNYHKEMLRMADEALEAVAPSDRDMSSVTVAINAQQMKELKRRVTEFRNSLLSWLDSSNEKKGEVLQVNFQVFPLTRRKKEEKR